MDALKRDALSRIERTLEAAVARAAAPPAPPRLAAALHHAVFPGGARVRPQLCLAVAAACGNDAPGLSARRPPPRSSCCTARPLVHDDLPCFDGTPRSGAGQPSVHCRIWRATGRSWSATD